MRLPAPLFNRKKDSHKRDFGHVLILAGSSCYTGAAILCAEAAMRSGAGMVTLGIPRGLHSVFASKVREIMTLPLPEIKEMSLASAAFGPVMRFMEKADCLLLGPGLSRATSTQELVRSLVRAVRKPCVLDADALFALSDYLDILRKGKGAFVLTPHPKEMASLLDTDVATVQKDRKQVAKDFTVRYNINLVLKGRETVVAGPDGRIYVNRTGNPGMATAGSGDVLAGILAAFIGQGIPAFEAARAAVYIHGLAGDLAARDLTEISLISSDIIDYLPRALKIASTPK